MAGLSPALALLAAGVLWALGGLLLPVHAADDPALAQGVLWMRICAVVSGCALAATGWLWRASPAPSTTRPAPRIGPLAGGGLAQLAVLIVVAAVLRSIRLDAGLWYDEIVTLVEFVRLDASELVTTYTSTNNHILFSLLAKASVALFGETAWALRLPAAGLGVASLAALWWMAHELAPAREARLASWLVALSYHHVWFSQNARGYTGILFWSWLGTALYLYARRTGARGPWLAYAATLGLAMYTHLSAVFVFLAHGLVFLGEEAWRLGSGRRARGDAGPAVLDAWPLVGFALGLLLVLQLYAILLPQLFETFGAQSSAGSGSAAVTTWKNPLWTALEIVRGLRLGPASALAALVAFALAAAGFLSHLREAPGRAMLMILPSPIALVALMAIGFNIWPRYFLVSLAFAAIVLVRGIFVSVAAAARMARVAAEPTSGWGSPRAIASALCIAVVGVSAVTVLQNYRFPKQDYSGARDFVTQQAAPGEPILAAGLAGYSYGRYYAPDWTALESTDQLDAAEREALGRSDPPARDGHVWLVYSFSTHLRAVEPDIWQRIERDFEVVRSFPGTLGDGTVHVLRSVAGPPGVGTGGARTATDSSMRRAEDDPAVLLAAREQRA